MVLSQYLMFPHFFTKSNKIHESKCASVHSTNYNNLIIQLKRIADEQNMKNRFKMETHSEKKRRKKTSNSTWNAIVIPFAFFFLYNASYKKRRKKTRRSIFGCHKNEGYVGRIISSHTITGTSIAILLVCSQCSITAYGHKTFSIKPNKSIQWCCLSALFLLVFLLWCWRRAINGISFRSLYLDTCDAPFQS